MQQGLNLLRRELSEQKTIQAGFALTLDAIATYVEKYIENKDWPGLTRFCEDLKREVPSFYVAFLANTPEGTPASQDAAKSTTGMGDTSR